MKGVTLKIRRHKLRSGTIDKRHESTNVSNKAYMYMLADLPSKPSDKASTVCQI
jgi:hypothetical protein